MSTLRRFPVISAAALLVLSVGLAACGEETAPTASDPERTTTAPVEPDGDPTETNDPVDESDLPGERMDLFWPDGAELAVVGVAADDVLNVRRLPDPGADAVGELAPLAEGVVSTGHSRLVDSGFWVEVEHDDVSGWANTAYLAYLGDAQDRTDEASRVGPQASLEALGAAVADELGGEDGTIVAESDMTIVIDLVSSGEGDDSVRGSRLRITASSQGSAYALDTVEVLPLCIRGVSDGVCL
ncbi:MAG: hypothetical protein Q8Q02_01270 [Nocardioides sp.]|nr:hypothetical protein [Nocardioides sp.]